MKTTRAVRVQSYSKEHRKIIQARCSKKQQRLGPHTTATRANSNKRSTCNSSRAREHPGGNNIPTQHYTHNDQLSISSSCLSQPSATRKHQPPPARSNARKKASAPNEASLLLGTRWMGGVSGANRYLVHSGIKGSGFRSVTRESPS